MSRGVDILLGEILEPVQLLQRYTAGLSYDAFAEDVEKQDAVIRRLEIIGEAMKGLPESLRAKYPDVPWRDIAGARDIMIHEYFRVDLELAWKMVQDDLPALRSRSARSSRMKVSETRVRSNTIKKDRVKRTQLS